MGAWIANAYQLARQRRDLATAEAIQRLVMPVTTRLLEAPVSEIPAIWNALGRDARTAMIFEFSGFGITHSHPLSIDEPKRRGRLRGYGNAINVYQALAFVLAALDGIADSRR